MVALWLLSVAALCSGPLLFPFMQRYAVCRAILDGLVIVGLGGLVLFHLLPECIAAGGWPALIVAVLGLLVPLALHGLQQRCSARRSAWLQALAASALALHAALDGVALHGSSPSRGAAIAIHRFIEGLGVWWLLRPAYGRRVAGGALLALAYASLLGMLGADVAAARGGAPMLALVQAGVAGSLLHVLLRHGPLAADETARDGSYPVASCVGGLVGLILLVALQAGDAADPRDALRHFLNLLLQRAAPAVGLALLGNVLLHALLPHALPAAPWRAAALPPAVAALWGALRGVCTDACSCGLLPIYRRAQAAAAGGALAYLCTAPALGLTGLCTTIALFGGTAAALRGGVTVLLGALVGGWAGAAVRRGRPDGSAPPPVDVPPAAPPQAPLLDAWHFVGGEVVDTLAPWGLLGIALAANLAEWMEPSWLVWLQQRHLEVPLLALAAAPLYLSSLSATLVAAALLVKGASAGATLAICLVGPTMGLTVHRFVAAQHGGAAAWRLSLGLWGGAVAAGVALDATTGGRLPPLLPLHASRLGVLAVVVLAGLFLRSLLRQGVRPFCEQIAVPKLDGVPSHHHHHLPDGRPLG